MAKARPKNPARDRAIAAFKKAYPGFPHGIETYKVRNRQVIRVRGYELPGAISQYAPKDHRERAVVAEWSYANNGSLERVN